MATLADKDKLEQILRESPTPMALGEIINRLGKPQGITSTLLSMLKREGKATNPETGVWQLVEATVKKEPVKPVEEPGSVMKPESVIEETPIVVPGAYEKFMQIGRSLGIKEDFLKVATDYVFQRDITNLNWVWDALNGMYLRPDVTKRWFNLWAGIINQPIPPELATHLWSPSSQIAKEAEAKAPTRFSLIGDEIVADPEGEFTFAQARQALMTKAALNVAPNVGVEKVSEIITAITPFLQEQRIARAEEIEKQSEGSILATLVKALIEERGGGQQPFTLNDALAIFDKIDEARRATTLALGATKPAGALDELERMANVFNTLKGIFGSRESSTPIMVPIKGADGETGAIPIDMFFKLQDHQRQVKREEEEFHSSQDMGKSVRKLIDGISRAASNMGK